MFTNRFKNKHTNQDDTIKQISSRLIEISSWHYDDVLEEYDTTLLGLSNAEATLRQAQHGSNRIIQDKAPAWYMQLLACFKNPFILILLGLDLFSIITKDTEAAIIISVMVTISVLISFTQEYRSQRTAEKLKEMVKSTASVIRQSAPYEIDMEALVPGDIIHLSAGDLVPADIRLLTSKDLFASESSLTGEALPVEKQDTLPRHAQFSTHKRQLRHSAIELPNMCYMGTNIISGSATGIVVSTGCRTYFGAMAKTLVGSRPMTSFDKGVNSVSFLLIRFMLIMVPIIFFLNGFTKGDWLDAFFFGLSVAVGLTPEMLPVIVTSNLAKGANTMARNKVVVKRLNAIQNFGAMNILCTDKTGTLTQDKIVLKRHLDIHGHEDENVLRYAYLNSFHQTGLKNLLDVAVLEHAELQDILGAELLYQKVDEIPFDFNRRRMSVILEKDNQHLLICKGAMEELLRICSHVSDQGQLVPMTDEISVDIEQIVQSLNSDGLRVVAVATKELRTQSDQYTVHDESDLTLIGYICFLDPAKESAAPAIQALHDNGVTVKVLTGDNEAVARKVCRDVGLHVERIVLGSEIDDMPDHHLADLAEQTSVFAKLNPLQKARIVSALQSKGHTVGFMGDGINDAASLREADVGISVDTAVDIAKESADIILLEKSLMVLEEGVIEGRKTFGNIIKYIKMTASSNFGNVFSVLGASVFLPFMPMLPIHLLIQNLFYDISQLSIPWDNMDKEFLSKPRKWDAKSIGRFMLCIGPISSIFDYSTFFVMYYVFAANTIGEQSLFQSGWFIEGLLSQTLIVHMIRTQKIPFFQSRASWPVLLLTVLIMVAGICIPFTLLGEEIGLQPLPLSYFPWLIGILMGYCLLTQLVKTWYIRKFNEWL
ncbi:magnesium-translocating P-type ATPase [Paenibacillus sp. UMB4589-SE434]|uniref:magnesium-translocating P-type ATPase n=1 Tax=Paenibacillus sp. UMB4589-SE434 TaxID=3046314 RepID=UPI00254D9808|nr:magnesium-translocating P-type ATPase [Paenibacillus sp. UMB4589-SE434]MDK8183823.1 magnesium-translocating P-type ATPase [Paenibacillus sp. UMB4589-SE434]